ncbi:hypothetical protein ACHQM5_006436 [Ranunculus cassubicifolius]
MATHQNPNFFNILSESNNLTKSHSRHFLALSVLFILPFSFSLTSFPLLQTLILTSPHIPQSKTLIQFHLSSNQIPPTLKPIIFYIIYALTLLTLYLCATSTITYSIYHGFYGRPVKLVFAIKSLFNSLIRLFVTLFCALIIVLLCGISVGLIEFGVISGIEFLGFEIEYSSIYGECFKWFDHVMLGLGLLWLCVNWVLAPVIVVVEQSWGLEPLRRSVYLVKGMRGVVVCLMLYFGLMLWLPVFGSWDTSPGSGVSVVKIVCASALLMFFLPHSLTANAILYMNCKALHGELAGEIVEEFAREYVTLPFGEEKVPHLVSIA